MASKRQAQGEKLYRDKFKEFGLSKHFEFIERDWDSDHGRKAIVQCKSCGKNFQTWNLDLIFKGKLKRLFCPECGASSDGEDMWTRTKQCDEAMAYYMEGHSQKETAKKFGVYEWQVSYEVQKRKISNGRSFHEAGEIALIKNNLKQSEEAKQRTINRLNELGFDYCGGWISKDKGKLTIKCRKCGHVFTVCPYTARRGVCKCPRCKKDETEIRKEAERLAKKIEAEERRREREANRKAKSESNISYYQKAREKKMDIVHVCKECGKEYTPRQYAESAGVKSFSNPGFCSIACRKRNARRKQADIKSIRHRVKKYGSEFDSSVTLKKLIQRDGLRCGICGGMCNPNDRSWTEHFGPTSPTIDHIYPLSKGGSHTWDNVQVAHAICNSTKKDNVDGDDVYDAS